MFELNGILNNHIGILKEIRILTEQGREDKKENQESENKNENQQIIKNVNQYRKSLLNQLRKSRVKNSFIEYQSDNENILMYSKEYSNDSKSVTIIRFIYHSENFNRVEIITQSMNGTARIHYISYKGLVTKEQSRIPNGLRKRVKETEIKEIYGRI